MFKNNYGVFWGVTGKDSGVIGVGKGSGHGTCLSLISFHGM